ncbi:MAG: ABC transporter ATP-binding protein [Lachnospiraceae bacterium]|nr:ABC transporter ATP-binding protein [Lachnospiraceae bacterium]
MIQIRNLVKKYGNHTAVDDISLDIEPGQVYGFLGPNGAGKSTTMNIITGYLAATSGEIKINGYDIYKEPEKAKTCIGYLPEIPPLYLDMTVYEYLKFVAELKGFEKAKIDNEVKRVMELTNITDVSERIINNLSKGYRQRVGFAQAIVSSPPIVILDEPTVGLDPNQIRETRDLIKSLGDSHTVILSSHILSEISETCSHVFIINKGKIIANDTIDNLSNYFNSHQVLEITAKGDKLRCKEIVEAIENVNSVSVDLGDEDGTVKITVDAVDNADVREDVSLALSAEKISIFEMKEDTKSLEDVFLQLTGKEEQDDSNI